MNEDKNNAKSSNTFIGRLVNSQDIRGIPGNKVDVLLDSSLTFRAYTIVPVLPRIQDAIVGVFYILPDDTLNYVDNGRWVTLTGIPGPDGTTFRPRVSEEGIISWTNDGGKPNPAPVNIKGPKGDPANAKVLYTSATLTTAIGGVTNLLLSQLPGTTDEEISAPETEVYDSAGTLGVVTAFDPDTLRVTVTTATVGGGSERRGVRLGAVNDYTDLPATTSAAEALGWQTPVEGDYAYVREDSSHDDKLTEWLVAGITGGAISWSYSHSLNSGNYQEQSSNTWAGMILTAGNIDGTFGDPLDPEEFRIAEITAPEVDAIWEALNDESS